MNISWTTERIDLLKKLAEDGLSCSEIANELGGVSRNAVVGKLYRLGIIKKRVSSAPHKPRRRTYLAGFPRALPPAVIEGLNEIEPEEAPTNPVTLMELSEHHCRWPTGAGLYCGAARLPDFPYCAGHCRKSYQVRRVA